MAVQITSSGTHSIANGNRSILRKSGTDLFAIMIKDSPRSILIYKSTDNGDSWSLSDTKNVNSAVESVSFAADFDVSSDFIHVVYHQNGGLDILGGATGGLYYYTYQISTETTSSPVRIWATLNQQGDATPHPFVAIQVEGFALQCCFSDSIRQRSLYQPRAYYAGFSLASFPPAQVTSTIGLTNGGAALDIYLRQSSDGSNVPVCLTASRPPQPSPFSLFAYLGNAEAATGFTTKNFGSVLGSSPNKHSIVQDAVGNMYVCYTASSSKLFVAKLDKDASWSSWQTTEIIGSGVLQAVMTARPLGHMVRDKFIYGAATSVNFARADFNTFEDESFSEVSLSPPSRLTQLHVSTGHNYRPGAGSIVDVLGVNSGDQVFYNRYYQNQSI